MGSESRVSGAPITKAPPWLGWVVFDSFFSSAASGIYLVAGLLMLASKPDASRIMAPMVALGFALMIVDLVCLVAELGDPARFHHMLRVFKPGSPMSIGAWSITAFSVMSFVASAAWLLSLPSVLIRVVVALGFLPAIVVANYKGVLFSATAQPGWRDMRWLGAAISTNAAVIGVAVVNVWCTVRGDVELSIRLRGCLSILIVLYAAARAMLLRPEHAVFGRAVLSLDRAEAAELTLILAALVLALAARPSLTAEIAIAAIIVAASLMFRDRLVRIPHRAK
jgi:hypothetical protein